MLGIENNAKSFPSWGKILLEGYNQSQKEIIATAFGKAVII